MKLLQLFLLSCLVGNAFAMHTIKITEDKTEYRDGMFTNKRFTVDKGNLKQGLQFLSAFNKGGNKEIIIQHDSATTPDEILQGLSKINYDSKTKILNIADFQRFAITPMLEKAKSEAIALKQQNENTDSYCKGYNEGYNKAKWHYLGLGVFGTATTAVVAYGIYIKNMLNVFQR